VLDMTVRPRVAHPRRVLVVDDSRAQRHVLAMHLRRWGYLVAEAATGAEALAICRDAPPDIVLSDWMMPGITGPDLCRAFRALPRDGYGYFILLTSKSGKGEVADGLTLGADDFLTKPVDPQELRARLQAGERIIGMQAELVEKNRALGRLYDALERDLTQARRLQTLLLRESHRDLGQAEVALLMRPAGHVGGDMVGVVDLAPGRVGLYAIDVAGHGVAAAMMTARLSGLLGGGTGSIVTDRGPQGTAIPAPDRVAARLNRLMARDFAVEQYFTLLWADLDLASGRLRLVQAGHPHPLLCRAGGRVRRLGQGGFPVGLLPEARFSTLTLRLRAGDRLLIPSDGITECPGPRGDYGEDGLAALLRATRDRPARDLPRMIEGALATHSGGAGFADDISALCLDYRGPNPPER
jgi:sigma-B regulation protein RsbU (phosphoserine phosphatase)